MTKLLIILLFTGALAKSLTASAEPPLLIDSHPSPVTLDAAN